MASFVLSLVDKITGPAKSMGKEIGLVSKALQGLDKGLDAAKNGLNQGRDAMGRFTAAGTGGPGMLGKIAEGLSSLGPYGMAAAISIVQEREGLLATFSALAGGAAGGRKTLEIVEQLGLKLPFATSKVAEWAKQLQAAGFQGQGLKRAIEAVAAATAVMGEQGGAAAQRMLEQLAEGGKGADTMVKTLQQGGKGANKLLQRMGIEVKDVAKALGMTEEQFKKATISSGKMGEAIEKALAQKGKGRLEQMGSTFEVIWQKAKEGLSSLFEGLGPAVDPFMKAVQGLFGHFNKGQPIMKSLGKIVTEVFSTLFKWATKAVTVVSQFIAKNLTAKSIGGTWDKIRAAIAKVVSALAPVGQAFVKLFTNKTTLDGLVMVFKALAAAVVAFVGIGAALIAAFGAIAGAIGWVIGALGELLGPGLSALSEWVSGAATAAANFIGGLVSGIAGGASRVVSAVKNLGSSALSAFQSVLGIHSDSAVMMQMADHMAGGLETGLDKGGDRVEAAAAGMGGRAAGGAGRGMGGGARGGGSTSINVTIQVNGAGKSWQEVTEEAFAILMERLAATQGLVASTQ